MASDPRDTAIHPANSPITFRPEVALRQWIELHFEMGRWRDDEANVHCRLHEDAHASASINVDKCVWKCQGCGACGTLTELAQKLGIELPPFSGNGKGKLEISRFDYRDAKGKILYQVVRFAPKSFRQFNPATGEWSVKGIPRVPYLLPRLLAGIKAGKVIYIAESTSSHPVSDDVLKATKGVL